MSELSRADVKILRTLQTEGRISNVDLAERAGMSASPCLRRVKQLEADGVISGYAALLDRRKLGLDVLAFVEVKVDRHNDAAAEAFRRAIVGEPEVIACYTMAGAFDYLLKVVATSLDAYADFTMQRLMKAPGVQDIRSSFVLQVQKDSTALPLPASVR